MIFQRRGMTYSISDANEQKEHVVVKINQEGKVDSARIIKGPTKMYIKNMVFKKKWDSFKSLDQAVIESENVVN
jgi:hypothetical protein